MAKSFLIFLLMFDLAYAQFFGFGGDNASKGKIPELANKVTQLDYKKDPLFEDQFNTLTKSIDLALEEGKLVCSGEIADSSGKVVTSDQKQLCFRELKKQYLESIDVIFEIKKKYLSHLSQRQIESLNEIQKSLKTNTEKSF